MNKVLVLGATSGIAQATVRLLAARGAELYLVGRNAANVEAVAHDSLARGARTARTHVLDLDDLSQHTAVVRDAEQALGGLDGVLLAYALLGDPALRERSWSEAERVLHTNLLSPASLLTVLAERFEQQKSGTLIVISSVAGDRGRQSNYVYGASKAALTAYCSGLRNRLAPSGVHLVTVKPGFVDTAMTSHLPKNRLFASPETVARDIIRAVDRRRNEIYTPRFWAVIMFAVRSIPETIFKRMRL